MEAERRPAEEAAEELQVATEELRVATEELAAQQQEIDELLAQQGDTRRTLRAVMSAVPVPLVTTSTAGAVVEANPAAAALLGVPPARLLHKPLQALVVVEDRRVARELLAEALRTGTASGRLRVAPRRSEALLVDVVITVPPGAGEGSADHAATPTWVLLPTDGSAADDPVAGGAVADDTDEALRAIAALRQLPVDEPGVNAVLSRIAALATRAVPGAGCTSVVLGDPVAPTATASDSAEAQRVDGAQWRAGEGPCRQAWSTGVPVVSEDLRADPRWPAFARALDGVPVVGAIAVPVVVEDRTAGVLNLYSRAAGALAGERDLDRASVFAAAAGAVLEDARRMEHLRSTAEQMQEAMRSRAGIEQAKGLVAAWVGCSIPEAWSVLSSLSQHRNLKLRDLAELVTSGSLGRDELLAELAGRRQRVRRRPATSQGR